MTGQIIDIPIPKIQEQTVDVANVMLQERVRQHRGQQIVQVVQKTVEIPQSVMTQTMDGILNVSAQDKSTGRSSQTSTTNQEGCLSQTEIDCNIQGAKKHLDVDDLNKEKLEAKSCFKNHRFILGDIRDAGHDEKSEHDASDWLDGNPLSEREWCLKSNSRRGSSTGTATKSISQGMKCKKRKKKNMGIMIGEE